MGRLDPYQHDATVCLIALVQVVTLLRQLPDCTADIVMGVILCVFVLTYR